MSLTLQSLERKIRPFMMQEMERDIADGRLYLSTRLSAAGRARYPAILKDAIVSGDDATFAARLSEIGMLNESEERQKPNGGATIAKMPRRC